jgi:hypothetical protein
VWTAAKQTVVDNDITWLGTRKWFSVQRSAVQSIPNSVATAITFDVEVTDSDGFGSVPSTVYTIPTGLDGTYAITAKFGFTASPGTDAFIRITAGGVNYDSGRVSTLGLAVTNGIVIPLSAANTIGLAAFQNSGAALNGSGTLVATWVGR